MKPTPGGWPRLSSALFYQDAAAAIDWLCDAFGFAVRLKVEGDNGRIEHSELTYGEGLIMVGQESPESEKIWKRSLRSPKSLQGACTQSSCCSSTMPRRIAPTPAPAAHASSMSPPPTTTAKIIGPTCSYGALDPEGHLWWITERLRNPRGAPAPAG